MFRSERHSPALATYLQTAALFRQKGTITLPKGNGPARRAEHVTPNPARNATLNKSYDY